jgi:hypothetical protein
MSTAEQKRAKPDRLAERDPQVYHPLDRLRAIVRRYVVIEGILSAILFVAMWFTLGLLLDYGLFKVSGWDWVQDGSRAIRALALSLALILFALLLVSRIVTRLTKEFSYASLALVLERRFPKILGDRLITAVEMADVEKMGKFGYSKEMLRATIAEARERVAKVPVSQVFNWKRLWVMGFLAVALVLATVAFSYASYAAATKTADLYRFGWKFAHVTGIFLERNVLLQNTPWPRRAHIDLVAFPESGELTVGRDAPPPKITARAYRWVVADPHQPSGWRPMEWDDVKPDLVGRSVPELPKSLAVAEKPLTVDTVERLAYESDEAASPELATVRDAIKQSMSADGSHGYEELQEVFRSLQAKADQPSMGRRLRRLDVPGEVTYKFYGRKSAGNGTLAPQQNNEFAGEIGGLKEDVEFVVRGADFTTLAKKIRLIPPPTLKRLGREQSEPAYLHHAPPQGEGYAALKGRLQKVSGRDLSLTGDATVFPVPAGTELTLTAEAYTADDGSLSDNDRIATAHAKPITGRFPGMVYDAEGKPTETLVPLKVLDNGEKFVIDFKNNPPDPADPRKNTDFRLMDSVKFELVWTNRYNITARRVITIQVIQDQPPTVEVAVDVIRKVGNVYLVTPKARIPFNPDSYIKDDHGLSKVEYTFSYYAEDSDIVRAYRVKYALRSALDLPLPGTFPSAFMPRIHADNFRLLDKADDRLTSSVFVSEFNNQMNLVRRDTRAQWEAALTVPKAEDAPAQAVRKVELKDPTRDYFDLKELHDLGLISLTPKRIEDAQPIFRMDLNVQATDNFVDNPEGPRVARNIEPIRLRIVPESDLLSEIAKEEEQLGLRLDEAIAKLQAARRKYEFVSSNNGRKDEVPEQVDAVKVRALDALGDVEKARDIVQSVVREMRRLHRECEINRVNDAALEGARKRPERLNQLLSEDPNAPATFPKAQGHMNQVQNALNGGKWAPLVSVSDAQEALYRLEDLLTIIRKEIGEVTTKDKLKADLQKIKGEQSRIRKQILDWQQTIQEEFNKEYPTFGEVGVLSFSKGETKQISQTIRWNQYKKDDIVVKLAVYDGANNLVADALVVPAELTLDFEKHQFRFAYELKALNKEGNFRIRMTPAVGPAKEIQVIVK